MQYLDEVCSMSLMNVRSELTSLYEYDDCMLLNFILWHIVIALLF
jgi:hypothetical protein